jgi:hypothetical protein
VNEPEITEAAAGPDVAALLMAVEAFCRRRKGGRAPARLAAELIHLRHGCDLLEVEFSETAAAFAATDAYDRQGSVTPIDWIRHNCQMSGHAAAERVCVGARLEDLPCSSEAVAAGSIGFAHLALMARTATAVKEAPTGAVFDEGLLLAKALDSSVGRFRHLCQHLRHVQDPAGFAAEQLQAYEARQLHLSSGEQGLLYIRGVLDPTGGAALRSALEPLARRGGVGDVRRREQRLADALVELAGHALDSGSLPNQVSRRAHLQVTSSLETLLGLAGAPAAELEFATPISARTVARLSCDCTLTRVLLGPDSAVIEVGRARRVVSGPTRRALDVRDRGCRWPGCDRPASWSAAHHLVHRAQGGTTELGNLVLLCHRHHRMVHEDGWQLVRTDDERLLTVPPAPPGLLGLARGPSPVAAA